jgi:GT2 family glycosyltransferase
LVPVFALLLFAPKAITYYLIDGSSDGTWDKVEKLKETTPQLKVIKFRRNYGPTSAMVAGFDHAQGEVIVTWMEICIMTRRRSLNSLIKCRKDMKLSVAGGSILMTIFPACFRQRLITSLNFLKKLHFHDYCRFACPLL